RSVGGAAVVGRGESLVAYVVATDGGSVEVGALRAALRQRLPEPMVPSRILVVRELPRTPSGKVDRKALPDLQARRGRAGTSPRGAVEETLAEIWAPVLGIAAVGREDGFFDLGGHSLLATQVISRVREALGVELPMRWLCETPVLEELAARIDTLRSEQKGKAGVGAAAIVGADRSAPLPLSFAQERLWFLDRLEPGGARYARPLA